MYTTNYTNSSEILLKVALNTITLTLTISPITVYTKSVSIVTPIVPYLFIGVIAVMI